ncbi:uncharacterized protein LOC126897447 [Daktulosphaira vitifoliae]|uniref:uncharacterized protein LOC126897447 n=1 Tax=Daktulosphaira vitifoliae TaxID=58002 RepID=UPI0021AAA416|nr:uncharacterized protein LOC126897447 [Daktulosphaira vitifoliae]
MIKVFNCAQWTNRSEFMGIISNSIITKVFNYKTIQYKSSKDKQSCQIEEETARKCADNENLKLLKNDFDKGYKWDKNTIATAAANGYLESLKYLLENDCPWNNITTLSAADNGHLECLIYAYENGCKWNELDIAKSAIKKGNLEILKYVHKKGYKFNELTTNMAAISNLEILKYRVAHHSLTT